jgi:hypothetical protein
MPHNRSRFVLLCQQLLALAVVIAIAAPAANLVTLDIVAPTPPHPVAKGPLPDADAGAAAGASVVAAAPVKPRVTDVALGGVSSRGLEALHQDDVAPNAGSAPTARLAADTGDPETDDLTVLSAPQAVSGLATVGVTWARRANVADDAITVSVRTEKAGTWSAWQKVPFHEEEGPDSSSSEGDTGRPGTDPMYVGAVDDVQVKAVTASGYAPAGMRLSLIDPGTSTTRTVEKPAIDTGDLDLTAAEAPLAAGADPNPELPGTDDTTDPGADPALGEGADSADDAALLAGTGATAKPKIYSRAQWGADERMRDKSSLHYGEVHAGFVHHTVNANKYTAAQVPAILRGIYAYHTQSRGWSDIGYNFLVDRFGRIWEGRYGGVARPVVGAHTLGYNDDAFAMSAIGNFEVARPPAAVIDAYGRLFAWKLSLHGVNASSTHQWVTKKYLHAINGHRDVGQTACPGKYLYAKIPQIRALAAKYQKSFAARKRTADLAGSAWPDVVVRDGRTKRAYTLRTGGQVRFHGGAVAAEGLAGADLIVPVGDVTGDGKGDLLVRDRRSKVTTIRPGDGRGHFGRATRSSTRFARLDLLTSVGDWNGDGRTDVVGRNAANKRLYVYYGNGKGTFGAKYRRLSLDWRGYTSVTGPGDLDHDGHADLLARTTSGRVVLVRGTRTGLAAPRTLIAHASHYQVLGGGGDLTNDGRPDVVLRASSSKAVWIYPGDGRGGIERRLGPYTGFGAYPTLLTGGQLAGTKGADLVGRGTKGKVRVFANNGTRAVEKLAYTGRTMSSARTLLNVGDWDGDGHGDVMTVSSIGRLYLYRGNGSGGLAAPVRVAAGFGSVRMLAAVGDMTGDGYPDLMGQPKGGSMRIYPSNHHTGLSTSYVAHSALTGSQQLGLGLWNGDGAPDSLVRRSDGTLVLYTGNGPGGLMGGRSIGKLGAGYGWRLSPGDVNGDGRPDLLVRDSSGRLWVLPGNSSGFGSRRLVTDGLSRFDLAG